LKDSSSAPSPRTPLRLLAASRLIELHPHRRSLERRVGVDVKRWLRDPSRRSKLQYRPSGKRAGSLVPLGRSSETFSGRLGLDAPEEWPKPVPPPPRRDEPKSSGIY
jgi:hypothetical protein